MIIRLLQRELLLVLRRPAALLTVPLFFMLVATLFGNTLANSPKVLGQVAVSVIWIGATLANLLALERLFLDDFSDGTLEQWFIHSCSPTVFSSMKMGVHWLVTALPLLLTTPLLAYMLQWPSMGLISLIASLLLGTITLSLLGGLIAALTVGQPRSGLLLALLLLPLYIPLIIFGIAAADFTSHGLSAAGPLAWLAVMALTAVLLVPWVVSKVLQWQVTES